MSALLLGLWLSGCSVVAAGSAPPVPAGSPPLYGTTWALVPLHGPVPEPGTPPYLHAPQLRFEAEPPRVNGSTGCNRLSGAYVLKGARLRLNTPATTRRGCLEEADAVERSFLAGLEQVRGWRIEGGLLFLADAGGTPVLRLRATP